ncbi:glycine cleavage system aminomethyltransferase GcvT [Actinoplanes missouriensis]|uniref:glycine cleavage system aminomethyltransferase GcvT n=1 Tax=Actinoplanes missouriensis TaxID=1866 RepID=UPI0002D93DF9|nr:glycine cleavage system aminomethyltransferase GcvT [Actinoplanes missouriensis]
MRRTALFDVHTRLGAHLTTFAGWTMPLRYGSDIAEHHTVRTAAGLFDLSHMGRIEVTGRNAAEFLDYALAGRLSTVKVGRAKYTMLCHTTGGVLDDLVVYRLAADRFLVVANAANAPMVRAMLGEHANGFAVRITDAGGSLIAVQGPASAEVIATQGPASAEVIATQGPASAKAMAIESLDLPYYGITEARVAGCDVLLARTGYTGEDGFEIYCSDADAATIWESLRESGATPAGLACRDTLRLEAGMPLYGHELTVRTTPFHAGLGRIVALDKADFVGAESLRRVAAQGPSTVLTGLVTAGRRAPRSGHAVLDPVSGERIGEVTSGAPSPTLGHPIAMAYVPPVFAAPGTRLVVDVRGTREDAEVVALPFYRRSPQ